MEHFKQITFWIVILTIAGALPVFADEAIRRDFERSCRPRLVHEKALTALDALANRDPARVQRQLVEIVGLCDGDEGGGGGGHRDVCEFRSTRLHPEHPENFYLQTNTYVFRNGVAIYGPEDLTAREALKFVREEARRGRCRVPQRCSWWREPNFQSRYIFIGEVAVWSVYSDQDADQMVQDLVNEGVCTR